jgi:hemoglobin-like flavoprotein
MIQQPRMHPGADMEGFVNELMAFTGLNDDDAKIIRQTAPMILKHERTITSALYEHFLQFPSTAQFFLTPDGNPDEQRLERRKHSLARWLRETAEVAMTHDFAYHLLAVSLSHSHRTHGPGGKIPPQFMIGAMSLAQTTFASLLRDEMEDVARAFDAAIAWNKLLLLHLNLLLLGYFLPAH